MKLLSIKVVFFVIAFSIINTANAAPKIKTQKPSENNLCQKADDAIYRLLPCAQPVEAIDPPKIASVISVTPISEEPHDESQAAEGLSPMTIYMVVDGDEIRYSATPIPGAEPVLIANKQSALAPDKIFITPIEIVAANNKALPQANGLNLIAFRKEIAIASAQHGVDEATIRAVIHAESNYKNTAVSKAGARGLMQLMPGTAKILGVKDRSSPQQNIMGGAKFLAELLLRYNGNLALAAAAYNAGPGAVDRHRGVPPYKETRAYVKKVVGLQSRYSAAIKADQ